MTEESMRPAWWRIVPKRRASDLYRRRFDTREEAQETLAIMRCRRTHKVVAYNDVGKRLPDA
jgi:hypothetical protein